MKALEQLLGMGRTAAGIAALLKGVPLPDEDALHDAMLPAAQGAVVFICFCLCFVWACGDAALDERALHCVFALPGKLSSRARPEV